MVLLFLGPSGSGKDTQADILSEEFDFEVISTGELLREISNGNEEMQNRIRKALNEGFLNDNIVYGLLEIYLKYSKTENIILTGVVRWETQIPKLDSVLENIGKKLDKVVLFNLTDEEVVDRLSGRVTCQKCGEIYHTKFNPPKRAGVCDICGGTLVAREDDNPEAIRNRLKAYHVDADEIEAAYKERGILEEIDASNGIEEIHSEVVKLLGLK